jgi:putative phage-type endonuclease
MRIIDVEQNTPEWLQARCGRITASRVRDVLNWLKSGKESEKRASYRVEILSERLTGRMESKNVNAEMQWGIDNEAAARFAYEQFIRAEVKRIGFVIHPSMDFFGASPDGLVGEDGGIEIKCPKTSTHLEWMFDGIIPDEHRYQMVAGICCTERKWWDFVSYDPRLPRHLRLFIVRMQRDESEVAKVEQEVLRFNEEVESMMKSLKCTWTPMQPKDDDDLEIPDFMGADVTLQEVNQ